MNLGTLFATDVTWWAALTAGVLSFFTPCVLPLIPAWLTLITGLSLDQMAAADQERRGFTRLFLPTLFFVLGFGLVFCLLGAVAGAAGEVLRQYSHVLRYLAGAFLVFFGLYLTGLIAPAFLSREHRAHLRDKPLGLAGSFVVGLGFAAGWTPCVGPVLAGILALAALERSAGHGLALLAVYSLGLGLPFLAISLAWGAALHFLTRVRPFLRRAGQVLGGLLIALGILVISGRLAPV